MEVHPPEHGIHTWRDFLVHMGTICLGLLIAIGLEQSVEALHHHRELAVLRESMRTDAETNLRGAIALNRLQVTEMHWLNTRIEQVQTALAQHTPLAAPPPKPKPTASDDDNYPADPSWLAAKASGVLSFMPEDEIKNYTEISKWIAYIEPEMQDWDRASRKRKGVEAGFCLKICDEISFAAATPVDLRQYLNLLEEEKEAVRWNNSSVHAVYGSESAILSGKRDLKDVQKAEEGAMPGDR